MPSQFRDEPFPFPAAVGVTGAARWWTEIARAGGGGAIVDPRWTDPLRQYKFETETLSLEDGDLDVMNAFQLAVACGKAFVWPLEDRADYIATSQPIGVGDGTTTAFQLTKTYVSASFAFSYVRKILLPQAATVQMFINDVLQSPSSWSLSARGPAGGVVTFTSSPGDGLAVTWSGQFDTPCRFTEDHTPYAWKDGQLANLDHIDIIEDRLNA